MAQRLGRRGQIRSELKMSEWIKISKLDVFQSIMMQASAKTSRNHAQTKGQTLANNSFIS